MIRNGVKVGLFLCSILSFGILPSLYAQSPQFSQFYAAPNFLNPAFAGAFFGGRVAMNYRHQWPGIPGAFISGNFSYDQRLPQIKSGIGLLITHDRAGSGALEYTNISGQYAYDVRLNKDLFVRAGIQGGLTWRGIDVNRLLFVDELVRESIGAPTTAFVPSPSVFYPDLSTGLLMYSKKFWAGISAHNINRPNQSFLYQESRLPVKYSVHAGVKKELGKSKRNRHREHNAVFAFNYKAQADFDQFDVGMYYEREPLILGLWYRGLPGIKAYSRPGRINHDAMIFLVGWHYENVRIGYSYDLTLSKLFLHSLGSHELSISFEIESKRKSLFKRLRMVPCAKF